MSSKYLFHIDAVGYNETTKEVEVQCGIEDEALEIVAACIVKQMKRHPEFEKAVLDALAKEYGNRSKKTDVGIGN